MTPAGRARVARCRGLALRLRLRARAGDEDLADELDAACGRLERRDATLTPLGDERPTADLLRLADGQA